MKKQILFALFVAAALPLRVSAQPPEEVPPPPPDSTEAGEVTVAPAPPPPPPQAPKAPAAPRVPVVAPLPSAAPAAPEDKTVKGVTVSPSIGLYPIGYDKINIGETTPSEGGRTFFRLLPGIAIDTAFKTGSGKVVTFNASYALDWREYYNKDTTKRDFNNGIEGSLGIEITPIFSAAIPVTFDYFYKTGADAEGDNSIYITAAPALTFKANDQLKFKIGYWMYYLNLFDTAVDPGDLNDSPSDIDDLRRGSLASDATGYNNYTPTSFGLIPSSSALSQSASPEAMWMSNSTAVLGVTYAPINGTSLNFDYRFAFAGFSNKDNQIWKGHYFIPKITQAMPWKGGGVSLTDEFRIRKYDYAVVDGTDSPRENFRNRITLNITQAINSYFGFEAFWRFQLSGENKDDYGDLPTRNWFYTGVNFTF